MLRDMHLLGYILWSLFMIIMVLLPYFLIQATFVSHNGIFHKSWNRNTKAIREEWNRGKRIFLLHFWDRRVSSLYREWFVFYTIYLVLLILLNVSQSINLQSFFPPKMIPVLPDIMEQVLAIQLSVLLFGFIYLLLLLHPICTAVPPHKSNYTPEKARKWHNTPVGRLIITVEWSLVCLLFIVNAIQNIFDILEKV